MISLFSVTGIIYIWADLVKSSTLKAPKKMCFKYLPSPLQNFSAKLRKGSLTFQDNERAPPSFLDDHPPTRMSPMCENAGGSGDGDFVTYAPRLHGDDDDGVVSGLWPAGLSMLQKSA